jgi:hypothetical protein
MKKAAAERRAEDKAKELQIVKDAEEKAKQD